MSHNITHKILILYTVVFTLTFVFIETKKEHAWRCMADRCCAIDFSKMLKSVDFVLYACATKEKDTLNYRLYFDHGAKMDFIAYEPIKEVDTTQYCGAVCDVADVCFKSTSFKITADNNGTAEWCFQGTVIVKNETLFQEDNVCLKFYNSVVELPLYLEEYMTDHEVW